MTFWVKKHLKDLFSARNLGLKLTQKQIFVTNYATKTNAGN